MTRYPVPAMVLGLLFALITSFSYANSHTQQNKPTNQKHHYLRLRVEEAEAQKVKDLVQSHMEAEPQFRLWPTQNLCYIF